MRDSAGADFGLFLLFFADKLSTLPLNEKGYYNRGVP